MSTLVIIAGLWLLWGAWWGYKRGAIRVLAGLIALLCGYLACFIWGWPLAQALAGKVSPLLQWPLATGAIFIAVGIVVQLLFWPLSKKFHGSITTAWLGAAGNAFMAGAMLVVALWATGFALAAIPSPRFHEIATKVGYSADQVLVRFSNAVMSRLIGLGLTMVGASKEQVQASVSLAQTPEQGLQRLQAVSGSNETKALLHSQPLKHAVASGNIDQLIQHPDFVAFSRQPGMDAMIGLVPKKAGETSERALATTLVEVWQRVEQIKQSDGARQVLKDPEIQAIMQSGDTARLMTHPKMQPLVAAIMEGGLSTRDAPVPRSNSPTSIASRPNSLADPKPEREASDTGPSHDVMFKWHGDDGQVHFSTWDRIPKAHREGAELINL
ncbi:MAG TPA: CvpA family protein [Marinagarivorans sp.]